jgi:thiamine kinase-like enzyme
MFQIKAPIKSPENHVVINEARVDRTLADGRRHLELEDPQRGKVEERGEQHRLLGCQRTGRHNRRDRVGAIMKPVHEVERQSHCNQQPQRPDAHI